MPKKDIRLQQLSESILKMLEEIRGLEMKYMDRMFMDEYLEQVGSLPIPASRPKSGIL